MTPGAGRSNSPSRHPPTDEPGGLDLPPLHIERSLPDQPWLRSLLQRQHKEIRDQHLELQAQHKELRELLEAWMREQELLRIARGDCWADERDHDHSARALFTVPLLATATHSEDSPENLKTPERRADEVFDCAAAGELTVAPWHHEKGPFDKGAAPTECTTPPTSARRPESEMFNSTPKSGVSVSKNSADPVSPTGSLSKARTKTFTPVQLVVQHQLFEVVFGLAVVLNGVFIGYQVDTEDEGAFAVFAQHSFNLIFLSEMSLRIAAEGFLSYLWFSQQRFWNYLDAFLVVSGALESSMALLASTTETPNLNHMRLLRLVRLTRLARVLRLARIVRFVSALQILLHSIVSTLKSMVWVAVLVVLVVYFFGIVFTQTASEGEYSATSHRLWGTLPRAMFTLFQVMTNGLDWGDVVVTLAEMHWLMVCIFMFFVIFVFFALTNVVTGVFCQAATAAVQRDRDLVVSELLSNKKLYVDKTRDLFTAMFSAMDDDGSGNISLEEFEDHVNDDTVQAYFAILELDTSDAYTLFKLMDADGSNAIDAEEFVDGCLKLKGTARSIDLIRLSTETRWLTKELIRFMAYSEQQLAALRAGHDIAMKGRTDAVNVAKKLKAKVINSHISDKGGRVDG